MNKDLLDKVTNNGKPGRPTGPRTDEGKSISSANSLKNGFYAKLTVLIPGEDPEEYARHREAILKTFRLEGHMEFELAQMVCDTMWRIRRIPRLEAHYLAEGNDKMAEYMGRQDGRLNRILATQMRELNHLIDERLRHHSEDMNCAIVFRMRDIAKNRPTDLKALGFVFSLDEVDANVLQQERWNRAVSSLAPGCDCPRGPVLNYQVKR